MPLILYNGKLLTRGGYLASSIDCCCDEKCPVGNLVYWAFYFTDADEIEVGNEDFVNEAISHIDGLRFGFDLRVVFSVGNPAGGTSPYYGEYQVWMVGECCPKEQTCNDTGYLNYIESYANSTAHITDASSQFQWDPNWQTGSCSGLTIESDAGIDAMAECVRQSISFPNDPATLKFHLRQSIEICC